jgi:hypothetical protein
VYASLVCVFRSSKAYEAKPGSLAAWLRLGEIAAQDVYCEPYDRKRLQASLPSLRELTGEPLDVFTERMMAICAACGVAVVFVPDWIALPTPGRLGVTRPYRLASANRYPNRDSAVVALLGRHGAHSSGEERSPYKRKVVGSNPTAPTRQNVQS